MTDWSSITQKSTGKMEQYGLKDVQEVAR